MTRMIELPPAFEEIAAVQAQKSGKSLEEYLPELIASALTQQSPMLQSNSEQQVSEQRAARIRRFRQWAESNGHDTPHLSDVEISREAIYTQG